MTKLSQNEIDEAARFFAGIYEAELRVQKTPSDQLSKLSWILNERTLCQAEHKEIWAKYGLDTHVDVDGMMMQFSRAIVTDSLGKEVNATELTRPILKKMFEIFLPVLLPETIDRLPSIFPEYNTDGK